ncbi:hypothetical protein PFISCL1PPCAC_7578, partial [Pristionchus fissidentatus]
IAFLLGKTNLSATFFVPGSDKFAVTSCPLTPDSFKVGDLFHIKWEEGGRAELSTLDRRSLDKCRNRGDYAIMAAGYRTLVLGPLLLGSRIRDYEQSCATVAQLPSSTNSLLILTTASRNSFLTKLRLRSETGESFVVTVQNVNRENPKRIVIYCEPTSVLPQSVGFKSRLQLCVDTERIPLVTAALAAFYDGSRSIASSSLMECIYGQSRSVSHAAVDKRLITVRQANGDLVMLNPEQSEAVHRYNSNCPAFAVESPPGSGKTVTAAAMGVSYQGEGVQLFLSTANIPVFNLAYALDELDYGNKKILHLISAELEASGMRSLFSIMETAEDDEAIDRFKLLQKELKEAGSKRAQRRIKKTMRKQHASALSAAVDHFDIILATVDMILAKLLKKKDPKKPCRIQQLLETSVRRIVVDEASQLTEAALLSLILCFPQAQIAFIGDTKQLPPYKFVTGDLVSEMCAKSALEVIKRKFNLPIIKFLSVYRAAPSVMAHYSDVFYGGRLVSGKPELRRNLLSCISSDIQKRCAFVEIRGRSQLFGTSLVNDEEARALECLVTILRTAGFDHTRVMIICYYDAQRKLVAELLPEGYEVLTVDSAQGREKDIVIVLTTRDSPTDSAFFSDRQRCNVALSRHQEALIVIGHPHIAAAQPWHHVLDQKYFKHV